MLSGLIRSHLEDVIENAPQFTDMACALHLILFNETGASHMVSGTIKPDSVRKLNQQQSEV
jgi:hypothetical protein